LDGLSADFEAVVLAIGMGDSLPLQLVEEQVPVAQRSDANNFLKLFNLGAPSIKPGASVLVIGGGNSAIDSARAALRAQAAEVVIYYRRGRTDMPAFDEEIEEALTEGVRIVFDSVVAGCKSQPDGRLKVEFNSFADGHPIGSHHCDFIITAIGQRGKEEVLSPSGLQLNSEKRVVSDPRTGRTTLGNVFAAGDICAGNHVSLIGAIAGGKKAANGVRALLEGYPYAYEGSGALDALNGHPRTAYHGDNGDPIASFDDLHREISQYYLAQPCRKCNHCIENFGCPALILVNGKVVIDDMQCKGCGLCIDVCINDSIHWVGAQESVGRIEVVLSTDG
jgi:thioredoxin reductase/Pyruvate/2-oxoacid:ferredoxin oxidoreductase delta subunit